MSRFDEPNNHGPSPIDWQDLVARHEEDPAVESSAWREALEAFDADPSERERALDADPLLLFRSMPAAEPTRDEIDAMKGAVAQLRRAKAVESAGEDSATDWSFEDLGGDEGFGRRIGGGIGRWLSAAALAAVSLSALMLTGSDWGPGVGSEMASWMEPSAIPSGAVLPATASPALSAFSDLDAEGETDIEQLPLIEDIGPSVNLVMQLEADGVDVVFLTAQTEENNPT